METPSPYSLNDADIETVYVSIGSGLSSETATAAAMSDDNANEIDIEGQEDGGQD